MTVFWEGSQSKEAARRVGGGASDRSPPCRAPHHPCSGFWSLHQHGEGVFLRVCWLRRRDSWRGERQAGRGAAAVCHPAPPSHSLAQAPSAWGQ